MPSKKKSSRVGTLCTTKNFMPLQPTFTPVLKGERIPLPVIETDGSHTGWARIPAPCDGFLVELGDEAGFASDGTMRLAITLTRRGRK